MTRQVGEATNGPLEASLNDLDSVIFPGRARRQ